MGATGTRTHAIMPLEVIVNRHFFYTLLFSAFCVLVLTQSQSLNAGTIETFDEAWIETPIYTAETLYNIVESPIVELSNDNLEIVVRDRNDPSNTPPEYRIDRIFTNSSGFTSFTPSDEVVPSPFGDDKAYMLSIPINEVGEYILEFRDRDIDENQNQNISEELRGVFVVPSLDPGIYLVNEGRIIRGVTIHPDGADNVLTELNDFGTSNYGQTPDVYNPVTVTNITNYNKRADAWTYFPPSFLYQNYLALRASNDGEVFESFTFIFDFDSQNNPSDDISVEIQTPSENQDIFINDDIDFHPLQFQIINNSLSGFRQSPYVLQSQIHVLNFDENDNLIAVDVYEINEFTEYYSTLFLMGENEVFFNINSLVELLPGNNRVLVFARTFINGLPLDTEVASVDFTVTETTDPLLRFENFGLPQFKNRLIQLLNIRIPNLDQIETFEYRYRQPDFPFISQWYNLNDEAVQPDISFGSPTVDRLILYLPTWFGPNEIEARATLTDGTELSDSYTHNIPDSLAKGLTELPETESLDPLTIDNVNEMNEYLVEGVFTETYFDFVRDNDEFRLYSILVNEDEEFLDFVDLRTYNINEIETIFDPMDQSVSWSAPIEVETGFNKIITHANGLDITQFNNFDRIFESDLLPPSSFIVDFEGEPLEREDIATLTEFTDFWKAVPDTSNPTGFETPERIDFTGFKSSEDIGNIVRKADLNDDGVDDFITITEFNSVWAYTLPPSEALTPLDPGFIHDKSINWTTLVGDLDQTGMADLIQITDFQIWTSRPTAPLTYPATSYLQDNPFFWDPDNGRQLFLEDMTNDGDLDLVYVFENENDIGELWMMEFMQTRFDDPKFIGLTNFQWDPDNGWQIVFGDFNGDGRTDVAQNTAFGDVWVSLAKDDTGLLEDPTDWGETGYNINVTETAPQWGFAARTNDSGRDSLILINNIGEVWIAESEFNETTESWEFNLPFRSTALGFYHDHEGSWQTYFGNFE